MSLVNRGIDMGEADTRALGLNYLRRIVALLYREIGVLRPTNHAAIAAKARTSDALFGPGRKHRAKSLYTLSITDPQFPMTLARYEKHTGLTVDDIREAFAVGRWGNPPSYGGPKWSAIASAAIDLAQAIHQEAWPEVQRMVLHIDTLEHNNGRIVAKFSQLD